MQKKNFISLIALFFLLSSACAQIEVAHLRSKDFAANGFGGFLNFAFPVAEYGAVSAEMGFYYFKKSGDQVLMLPLLLGYRYMLQDPEEGFFVEPNAGYNIGFTDIQKEDENGQLIYDPVTGEYAEQKAKGITAGLGAGYVFNGKLKFNLGLRYQRIFVSGDPSYNLFSFRISHPLSFRRRE